MKILKVLADSKIAAKIGAALVVLATICTTMNERVLSIFVFILGPDGGKAAEDAACSAIAILGAFLALYGKSPAENRTSNVVPDPHTGELVAGTGPAGTDRRGA